MAYSQRITTLKGAQLLFEPIGGTVEEVKFSDKVVGYTYTRGGDSQKFKTLNELALSVVKQLAAESTTKIGSIETVNFF